MAKIFLLLTEPFVSDTPQISWYVSDTKKSAKKTTTEIPVGIKSGAGTLEEFSDIYQKNFPDTHIVLIVSGQCATHTTLPVTVKNPRQLLQALPFMVEEQVIGNIEDMHIATNGLFSGDLIHLVIVDKGFLEKIFSQFSAYNLHINEIFSLPDLLIVEEGRLQILLQSGFVLVKDKLHCFQCDPENLQSIFEAYTWDDISQVNFYIHEEDKKSLALAKTIKSKFSSELLEFKPVIFVGDILPLLCKDENLTNVSPINIAQGNILSANASNWSLQKWVPLAWVALLCLFLQIGFNITSGLYFYRRATQVESSATALYLKLFPDEKKVVSLASQLKAKTVTLSASTKGSRFPGMFGTTIGAMKKINNGGTRLKQFRYDDESGELKLSLDISSVSILDNLKKQLLSQGISVDIVSANEEGGIIKAVLLIKYV